MHINKTRSKHIEIIEIERLLQQADLCDDINRANDQS